MAESDAYGSVDYETTHEVQRILTYFRSGDDVKTRGGTFTLAWGGQTSAQLPHDISAFDLEQVIGRRRGVWDVSTNPIHVTRQ